MHKIIILILKGFLIGIGKIIPGVSGSLIALNLGLYERGIYAISNFFKDVKNNLIFLGTIGIGILSAIIIGSKVIDYALFKYYEFTMFLFLGLIVATVPQTLKNVNFKNKSEKYIFLLFFIIVFGLYFFKNNNNYIYSNTLKDNLYVILVGFIDALTMIIPGISGTITFMLMGCYEFFLSIFSSLTDINNILKNLKIIILFILGLLVGIILITKLMHYLLNKKGKIIYPIITAFSISSIFILFIDVIKSCQNIKDIIIGIFTFLISFKIVKNYN